MVDADSTAIGVETLDKLAELVISAEAMAEFQAVTSSGMDGTMSFAESLERRLALMKGVHRDHVIEASQQIADLIDPTILERRDWIMANPDRIHIVSGGFEDLLGPAMEKLGVRNLHANKFIYDQDGFVIGADADRLTTQDRGKAAVVASLKLKGLVVAIGDGINDLQIRDDGHADLFIAYTRHTGHEDRGHIIRSADGVADSFAEPLLT